LFSTRAVRRGEISLFVSLCPQKERSKTRQKKRSTKESERETRNRNAENVPQLNREKRKIN
jgi:hypothetical protein